MGHSRVCCHGHKDGGLKKWPYRRKNVHTRRTYSYAAGCPADLVFRGDVEGLLGMRIVDCMIYILVVLRPGAWQRGFETFSKILFLL